MKALEDLGFLIGLAIARGASRPTALETAGPPSAPGAAVPRRPTRRRSIARKVDRVTAAAADDLVELGKRLDRAQAAPKVSAATLRKVAPSSPVLEAICRRCEKIFDRPEDGGRVCPDCLKANAL